MSDLSAPPLGWTIDLPTPARALAIGAHPDDVEFGCGGTLAKWAANGCQIFHAICTDGSKGSWDAEREPAELVRVRQREQREAAHILGGRADVTFFGWVDGELESGRDQCRAVARLIRTLQPEVVFGHDPWKRYRLHPDHRHAGFLVTDALVAARDPLFLTDLGIAPYRPQTLLLWEADAPDHVEDIADTLAVKYQALLAHDSQLRSTMAIPDGSQRQDTAFDAFRNRLRIHAEQMGAPAGVALGEAFKRIDV